MQPELKGFFPTLWLAVLDYLFPNWGISLRMFNDSISLWRQKKHISLRAFLPIKR